MKTVWCESKVLPVCNQHITIFKFDSEAFHAVHEDLNLLAYYIILPSGTLQVEWHVHRASVKWVCFLWEQAMIWLECWAGVAHVMMTHICHNCSRGMKRPALKCWTGECHKAVSVTQLIQSVIVFI